MPVAPPSVSGMSGVESIDHVTNAQQVVEVRKTQQNLANYYFSKQILGDAHDFSICLDNRRSQEAEISLKVLALSYL